MESVAGRGAACLNFTEFAQMLNGEGSKLSKRIRSQSHLVNLPARFFNDLTFAPRARCSILCVFCSALLALPICLHSGAPGECCPAHLPGCKPLPSSLCPAISSPRELQRLLPAGALSGKGSGSEQALQQQLLQEAVNLGGKEEQDKQAAFNW